MAISVIDGKFVFDIDQFRIDFPQFSDSTVFSDVRLQAYWDWATCYISDCDYGYLSGACRYYAIELMVAHLAQLNIIIAAGEIPGQVIGASISKISVTLQGAPNPNQWEWWLNQTPYGQQLLALLQAASVGGFFIGGSPERLAFRNVGGCFGPSWYGNGFGGGCC